MFLLDTCTLLWLVADPGRLSPRAASAIREHPESLLVSSISAFEIGIKHRKKKLELPLEPERWFSEVIEHHGLLELPVDGQIASRSTSLPAHHWDPCDRIITATADLHHLEILTPDALIRRYDVRVLW